jgi:hypothetical protein
MRWAGHVQQMGEMRNTFCILVENMKGRDHSEDIDVDGRIILTWSLQNRVGVWTGFI